MKYSGAIIAITITISAQAQSTDIEGSLIDQVHINTNLVITQEAEQGVSMLEGVTLSGSRLLNSIQQVREQKKIYESYRRAIDYVERVSETIQVTEDIIEAGKLCKQIMELYAKYGIRVQINSLYDFDTYLNPREQARHRNDMTQIIQHVARSMEHITNITTTGKWKMSDSERYDEIHKSKQEIEDALYGIQRLIFRTMATIQINKNHQKNIEVMKTMWMPETYW